MKLMRTKTFNRLIQETYDKGVAERTWVRHEYELDVPVDIKDGKYTYSFYAPGDKSGRVPMDNVMLESGEQCSEY